MIGSKRKEAAIASGQAAPAPLRFSIRATSVRLFLTCWLVYVLHFATNTVREIYPALSLGDHLSFDVSEYAGFHPDIFSMPGRGVFINNNPGASILGAIPYAMSRPVLDRIIARARRSRAAAPSAAHGEYQSIYPMAREFYRRARERGLDLKFGLAAGVMQAFCMAPLSALSALVMFRILLSLAVSMRASVLLSLLYAFATPVFYRTAQLNQNLLVAHCAFFSFALLWRPWAAAGPRAADFLAAGLLCGWSVVCDYSGLMAVLAIGSYALARFLPLAKEARPRAGLLLFVGGVAACLVVLMGYQWACFGNPFYPAQRYMPPANYSQYGYHGMDWPHLDLLWATALSPRFGLFTSAPLLLLAFFPAGWRPAPGGGQLGVRELRVMALLPAAFFVFCAANQYGWMQFNSGVRYIVPVVPFLFLPVAQVLLRLKPLFSVPIGIVASYWSWCLAMYRDVEQGSGILESIRHITFEGFRLPWLTAVEKMAYFPGGLSAALILAIAAVLLWALWNFGSPQPRA